MPELPKPRTWIITPPRTFADIENVANAEAAANGWAVKVELVVVDAQEAALVIFSEKAAISVAPNASGSPLHLTTAALVDSKSHWENLIQTYRNQAGVSSELKTATLAQWILESGRGTSVLSREHLNFGGLKFRARMSGHADPVDYRGSDGELTTYCKFSSIEKFIAGYWYFIDSGPYEGWKAYKDNGAGYIRHIAKQGYAPGPDYPTKVLSLFQEASGILGLSLAEESSASPSTKRDASQLQRLAIIVGHNEASKGAPAASPISKFEFDYNSVVANHMLSESRHYNFEAKVFFRKPSSRYSTEIAQAYQTVAKWGADCAVELHFNSSDTDGRGTEVLCRQGSDAARSLSSHIAQEIQDVLGFGLRHNRTGVKIVSSGERGAGSLYALEDVPTVIVEPFFGSNPAECLKVASLGEQVLALAYLRGVRDWAISNSATAELLS